MRWALPWATTALGLVPLAFLLAQRRRVDAGWWWMAGAFGVSFLADVAGDLGYSAIASQVYPVTQAALIAVTLASRRAVVGFVALMLAVASASVVWRGGVGLDVALRVVAFGGVALLAWRHAVGTLRASLVLYFGWGLISYLAYVAAPGWFGWWAMQGARVVGIGWWCAAAWQARRAA